MTVQNIVDDIVVSPHTIALLRSNGSGDVRSLGGSEVSAGTQHIEIAMACLQELGARAGLGDLDAAIIVFGQGVAVAAPVGRGAVVAIADPKATLGLLLSQIRKLAAAMRDSSPVEKGRDHA